MTQSFYVRVKQKHLQLRPALEQSVDVINEAEAKAEVLFSPATSRNLQTRWEADQIGNYRPSCPETSAHDSMLCPIYDRYSMVGPNQYITLPSNPEDRHYWSTERGGTHWSPGFDASPSTAHVPADSDIYDINKCYRFSRATMVDIKSPLLKHLNGMRVWVVRMEYSTGRLLVQHTDDHPDFVRFTRWSTEYPGSGILRFLVRPSNLCFEPRVNPISQAFPTGALVQFQPPSNSPAGICHSYKDSVNA
jgi:hypothetical protein